VVIGADGIHSNARGLVFGDDSRFVRHLGPYAVVWDVPAEILAPGTGFMYSHPGRTAFVERPVDERTARAFLAFMHPAAGTMNRYNTGEILRMLQDVFAEDRWRPTKLYLAWCAAFPLLSSYTCSPGLRASRILRSPAAG
jgi:2-polyprenyl-6-methoxyphenol hydroxylase-like FAD-dependent oxidoreductase